MDMIGNDQIYQDFLPLGRKFFIEIIACARFSSFLFGKAHVQTKVALADFVILKALIRKMLGEEYDR